MTRTNIPLFFWRWLVILGLGSWMTTHWLFFVMFKKVFYFEMTLGWGLAVLYFLTGTVNKRLVMCGDFQKFFIKAAIVNTGRIVLFLLIILAFIPHENVMKMQFILSIFIAYFVFLSYDVLAIHRIFLKKC